jgi:hypothetical protein
VDEDARLGREVREGDAAGRCKLFTWEYVEQDNTSVFKRERETAGVEVQCLVVSG